MKKTHKIFTILSFIIFIVLFFSPIVSAWDNCPFGLKDDPYPGTCGRYVDENNDKLCDYSQSEPTVETQDENAKANSPIRQQNKQNRFPILLIISFVIIASLILILKVLVERKKLSNVKEKIILNILLLIFFIPSAITGIILLLMTNMGILIEFGPNFIQLHTISSLFFMWISAYHITWHTKYYLKSMKNLFK